MDNGYFNHIMVRVDRIVSPSCVAVSHDVFGDEIMVFIDPPFVADPGWVGRRFGLYGDYRNGAPSGSLIVTSAQLVRSRYGECHAQAKRRYNA